MANYVYPELQRKWAVSPHLVVSTQSSWAQVYHSYCVKETKAVSEQTLCAVTQVAGEFL